MGTLKKCEATEGKRKDGRGGGVQREEERQEKKEDSERTGYHFRNIFCSKDKSD